MTEPLGSAILFSGGVGHPFAQTSAILATMLRDMGFDPRVVTGLDEAVEGLRSARLLAVNALYWSMSQHEKYAPLRDEWARIVDPAQIAAIDHFVRSGGRLLALHTAVICWDTDPRWHNLLGGGWDWSRSHHPDLGPFTVELTEAGRQLSAGDDRFEIVDEAYHRLDPAPDCTILATADLGYGPQPLAWSRQAGDGKVAVDALGHDGRSLGQEGHQALLSAQLRWLAE